jgi:hypothetical protein
LSDKHAFNVEEVIEVIRDCVAYYDERDGGTALESPVPPSVPVPGPVEDEAEQRDPVLV